MLRLAVMRRVLRCAVLCHVLQVLATAEEEASRALEVAQAQVAAARHASERAATAKAEAELRVNHFQATRQLLSTELRMLDDDAKQAREEAAEATRACALAEAERLTIEAKELRRQAEAEAAQLLQRATEQAAATTERSPPPSRVVCSSLPERLGASPSPLWDASFGGGAIQVI